MRTRPGHEDAKSVTPPILPAARRESLGSKCTLILKQYLLSDSVKAGDRLPPERQLAEALNVSRTVLREAINQLVGQGLLRRDPSRSTTVAKFDRTKLAAEMSMLQEDSETEDLIELRVLIELGSIELIVKRATKTDLAEIERWVLEGERRVGAGEPLTLAEVGFHAALLRTLRNTSIDGLLPLIEEHMRSILLVDPHELTGILTADDSRTVAEHRHIFEAVKRRDAKGARELMLTHLSVYLEAKKSANAATTSRSRRST